MKILPVIQNTNGGNTSTPVFCAKSKSKAVSQITDGIIKDLSKAVQADGRAQKIKNNWKIRSKEMYFLQQLLH